MAELGEAPAPATAKPEEPQKTEPPAAILPTPGQPLTVGLAVPRASPLMNTPGTVSAPFPFVAPGIPQNSQTAVWPAAYNPWQAYYGMIPGVGRPLVPQVTASGVSVPGIAGYTNQWLQQMRLAAPPPPPGTQ